MAKANNTNIYKYDEYPSLLDYLFGSDFEDYNKNKSFRLNSIIQLINGVNGKNNLQFIFSDGADPAIDYYDKGYFFTDTNSGDPSAFTKLILNKSSLQPIDLTFLFRRLDQLQDVVLKLENPVNPNNFFNFRITAIDDQTDYFVFDVEVFKDFYFGTFLTDTVYSIYFDIKSATDSDPLKLDKSTYTGNAQDLDTRIDVLETQTDVDNTFITKPTFSLLENVLTIGAVGKWRLDGVVYTNPASVSFPITFCAAGKTRLEYFVPNNLNGFTKIPGAETLGIAIAPPLPIEDFFVTYLLVSDSGVGEPITPPKTKTPTLDQVLKTGNSTKSLIWFFNAVNSKCLGLFSDNILFQKLESVFNHIRADNTTQSYTIQLPNKLGGAEQTFAMTSDLTKANVGLSNVDNTSDANKPISIAQQAALDLKLNTADYNQHFKGVYLTEAALIAAHPTGVAGDYAQVNETGSTDVVNYSWDAEESIWVNNGTGGSGAVNTDALPEGSVNLYFTVARFLANLTYANVIAALGFTPSTAPNDAQKNSDITKAEIEAKLTGEISTHTHQRTDVISLAMSDSATALATGDTDPMNAPYNFTLVNYWIGVKTAPTISSLMVDVKKNGTSITSTKAGIDATEKTSLTGTTPVLTTATFVKGDEITPNIYQVGSGETGKALKLYLEIIKT